MLRHALLLLCLAAALIALVHAVNMTSATYKVKSGEVQRAALTVLEYDVLFDKNISVLQGRECPAIANCTAPAAQACPPCNYASKTNCGKANAGCPACPANLVAQYCRPEGDWIEVQLDADPLLDILVDTGTNVEFRWYFGPEMACRGATIKLSTIYGDPDIETLQVVGSAPYLGWTSLNSGGEELTVCPTDPSWAVGTWSLSAYGYLSALTTFRVTTYAIQASQSPFVPCNLSSTYQCLQGDTEYQLSMPEQVDFHYSYYAYAISGPCPRFFSLYMQNVAPEALFTRLAFSLIETLPDPNNRTQFENLYIFEDFSRHKGTISFCPDDTSKPSIVYITVVKENPEQSQAILRVTSSPNKIRPLLIPRLAETDYDLGHKMLQYVMVRSPSLLVMPCDSFYGTAQCKLYEDDERAVGIMTPTPPYSETNILNPPWPWLWVTKRSPSVVDGSTQVPLNGSIRLDKFSFSVIARTELVQDGVAARSIYIDETEYPDIEFRFRGHVVDPETGLPLLTNWTRVTPFQLPCTQNGFFAIKAEIANVLDQLQGNSNETTAKLLALLDFYNFRDAWAGCVEKLRTYLVATPSSVVVRDTTICTPELTAQDDPCCSLDGLWDRCCRPRDVELPVVSFPELVQNLISNQCPGEETCMEQFLNEYRADVASKIDFATGCSGSSLQRDTFFRRSNAFWKSCMDEVFGEQLGGTPCQMDSDCNNTDVEALRCDMNSHTCVYQPDTLARRFLRCFLQNADPFIRVYLISTELQLNGTTVADSDLVELLFQKYQTQDCLPNYNVDPQRSRHYVWQNFDCDYLCNPDPLCLYDLCTLPLACMWQGFPSTECTRDPLWAFADVTAETCADPAASGECNSLNPPGDSCTAGSFCGLCDTDHCWEVPGIADPATCNNTWVCVSPVVNSSYQIVTDPAQCTTLHACTAKCWDGTKEIPCASQQLCQASGVCSDYDVFTSDTDPEGACVLPARSWLFGSSCLEDYSLLGSSSTFLGCINASASRTECPSQGLVDEGRFGKWYTRARTQAQCLGHGSGCVQLTPLDVSSSIIPQFLTPKNASECSACGLTQEPYYDWTPGRWADYNPRRLQWRARTNTPLVQWRTGFGYNLLGDAMTEAINERYDLQVRTEQSCRFNRVLQSLGGVACSCLASQVFGSGDACIEGRLDSSVAIGVSEPCGGRATTVTAVPFSLQFDETAVPSGRCVNLQLYTVSRLDYRYVKIISPGSTFIPKPGRARFEFLNSKRAVVGEMVLDGIRAELSRTAGSRPPFTVCVSEETNGTLTSTLQFPLLDFAVVEPDSKIIRPLNTNISVANGFACALINDSTVDLSDLTLFLVRRKANWATIKFRLFNDGEKALLILSGIWYVLAFCFCVFVAVEMFIRKSITYQLQIVWPIMILFIVRFVYWFVLAGGGLQSEKFKPEEFFLTDFPLNLYISVMAYLVTFWILIVGRKVDLFLPLVALFNIPLYLLFIAMIILMRYLPYTQQNTFLSCQVKDDPYWTNRRIANVAYKIFLAVVCMSIALAFSIYGRRIYLWLRKVERTMEKAAPGSQKGGFLSWLSNSVKILISALFSTVSLIITCVFLLILATISWRSTVFGCLFLWFIELLPLILLLYLARQQGEKSEKTGNNDSTAAGTKNSGTQSDPSVGNATASDHGASFEFRPWDEGDGGVQMTTT